MGFIFLFSPFFNISFCYTFNLKDLPVEMKIYKCKKKVQVMLESNLNK